MGRVVALAAVVALILIFAGFLAYVAVTQQTCGCVNQPAPGVPMTTTTTP